VVAQPIIALYFLRFSEDLFGCVEVCEEASMLNQNVSWSLLTSSMGVVVAVGEDSNL
jgi:hypothetical protein